MWRGRIQPAVFVILAVAASNALAQWIKPSRQVKAGTYTLLTQDGGLYAGTDGEGAYFSSNRGDTWTTINNGFPARPGVYTFAEFGGRLFAGTYDGVYYSNDNGTNWTRSNHENWKYLHVMGLAGNGRFLYATPNQGNRYIYNGGLFRSADSGLSWTPVNSGFTATMFINTIAQHKNNLYVGTSGEGAFRSTDNGETWTPFNKNFTDGAESNPRCFFSHGDNLYAGTGTGVYVLADGNAWKRISKGLQATLLITSIVAYKNHLFAGASMLYAGGVFHSADGGASWQRVSKVRSEPLQVTSLAVLGDELFASTGESDCSELGCNGSTGTIWRVSLPELLGTTANRRREPEARYTGWQKMAVPGETIRFEIASRSFVTLKAHDAAGKLVSSLVEREYAPGKYSVPFAAASPAKGPLFMLLRARSLGGNPEK